jgi:hypothetical protein
MDSVRERYGPPVHLFTRSVFHAPEGEVVQDLAYIGLTIVVFAVLFLLIKGVERFER